ELPSNQKIIVGGDSNFPPYEFVDKFGQPAGCNVDITRAIEKEPGLNIEIQLAPWSETLQSFDKGKIDALQGIVYSRIRGIKYDFSPPHTIINHVSVIRKGEGEPPSTVKELENKKIAVQSGDIMKEFSILNGLEDQITTFDTPEEALERLSLGQFDCVLLTRLNALYLIEKNKWKNLDIGHKPLLRSEYCYAVQKDNKPLLAQFSEGLKSIEENGEYRRIYEKWMGVYKEESISFTLMRRYAAMILVPLFFLLIISLLWTWLLRRLVAKKTAELKQSETQFRSIVEAIPDAVYVHNNYCFSYLNASACKLFGIYSAKQLIGKPIMERFHPDTYEIAIKRINAIYEQKEYIPLLEQKYLRIDRSEVPVEVSAVPIIYEGKESALVFVKDITSRKEIEQQQAAAAKKRESLENQLRQAQKMESVGRLAGGVAHDYNNMLSVINGYTELAMDKMDPADPIFAYLKEIHSAGIRSAEITNQLLAFARKQTINPRVIDLNITIESMLKTIRRLIGESIELDWHPTDDIWKVKMDSSQVDQILVNLCVNARDAIADIGRITIETRNIVFDKEYCAQHRGFLPGEFVLIAVSDSGSGMDKKTTEFIFEPFFTTKALGLGTGLGLSTVYGIIKQNNGFINVYSETDKGSTFKLYIPKHHDEPMMEESDEVTEVPTGLGETILVVEDELSILKLTEKMIEKLGYNVLTSDNPVDAINLAGKYSGKIDLLITDVVMPEMNGRNLAEKIQEIFPDIKVLYMSGYTANVIAHQGVLEEGVFFIQKPFSINDLGIRIKEAMQKE
ncbi:MAG: transporter substrate-binding domain-containing protein, partial [Spirochaetia bacterium]|nr:transporter substrate-binding domain-containing protein [Spirochaetia bacterium]